MKKTLLSLALLAFMASCNNQNNSGAVAASGTTGDTSTVIDPTNAAAFKFEKDSYDFGQITEGEQVKYEFSFTNIGKNPLIISDAQASCGCTVPDYPKKPIAPGETGTISVVFSSAGKTGMQNKIVSVIANTIPSKTELHLIGDVKPGKTK